MADDMLKDERFSHITRDPKFKRIPKHERKVEIDERFKSVFTDKRFQVNSTVDKRGGVYNPKLSEGMEKYYHYTNKNKKKNDSSKSTVNAKQESKKDDDESNDDDDDDADKSDDSTKSSKITDKNSINNDKQLKIKKKDGKIDEETRNKLKNLSCDYARGEGQLFTDSSSDDSSDDEDGSGKNANDDNDDDEEEVEHKWGELDKEAGTTDEITSRLAACNMDWDRIRAVDLMVLFNSFLQAGGLVNSVEIYPSEYGLKRLQEEDIKGPIELVDCKKQKEYESDKDSNDDDDDGDSQNEEGSSYTMEKMRQYQLNRLKYYYAVITFDSSQTANKVYTECDGIEYESTSTKLDLRFIPDDMTFDHEPKEICDKLPDPSKYMPRLFTTTALQQVKVELTWDETKPERREITQKINSGKIDELDENDIRNFLASGTSDEESDNNDETINNKSDNDDDNNDNKKSNETNTIEKYKLLLKSIEKKEEEKKMKNTGLELTWEIGDKENAEKILKKSMKEKELSKLDPFSQRFEKIKEKKKLKREEKKKLKENKNNDKSDSDNNNDDDDDDDDSIPSDIDMNDPYFAEEMTNRKQKLNNNKKKNKSKSNNNNNDDINDDDSDKQKAELELLLLDKDNQQDKQHFNMKKIEENELLTKSKKKRLSKKKKEQKQKASLDEDNFEVDVNDSRFGAIYNSHYFNIDPADSHYKKTKGTEALVKEKLKRRANKDLSSLDSPATKILKQSKEEKMKVELAALVKSVKRNTKNISQKN